MKDFLLTFQYIEVSTRNNGNVPLILTGGGTGEEKRIRNTMGIKIYV